MNSIIIQSFIKIPKKFQQLITEKTTWPNFTKNYSAPFPTDIMEQFLNFQSRFR